MMLVELTSVDAADLPIAEFGAHLRLGTGFADDGSENAVLEAYLRAAMSAVEARIGKALMTRRFSWQLTGWRDGQSQALPVAPVSAVVALKITDGAGAEVLVPATDYYLQKDSLRPMLVAVGGALPVVQAGGWVDMEFDAGFGPLWADVPVDLAQAVFLLAAFYFENRAGSGGREDMMPFGVLALIESYRNVRVLGGGT
jgi:uncharacterized phiE125 gp8 family phage protein